MAEKFKTKKLKKDQLYFMYFDSGYREYFAIGKNLDVMAEKLLKRYNKYCIPEHEIKSLEAMSVEALENGWYFNTYIIEIDSASDMDYRDFDGSELYLGDYLQKVRKDIEKHLSE